MNLAAFTRIKWSCTFTLLFFDRFAFILFISLFILPFFINLFALCLSGLGLGLWSLRCLWCLWGILLIVFDERFGLSQCGYKPLIHQKFSDILELIPNFIFLFESPLVIGFLLFIKLSIFGSIGFCYMIESLLNLMDGRLFSLQFSRNVIDLLWELFQYRQEWLYFLEIQIGQTLGLYLWVRKLD